jgi:hypothetical protein
VCYRIDSLSPSIEITLVPGKPLAGFFIGGFMAHTCPSCKKGRLLKYDDRKYLDGFHRERVSIALISLQPMVCKGRKSKGCGKTCIQRTEYPLDNKLAPVVSHNQEWSVYKNAKENKPGIPVGGTTYSEFTLLTGRDTEDVWWRILGYEQAPKVTPKALRSA